MFETGDAVIHPANGAGIIVGLAKMPMLDKRQQYYKIEILGKTKTIIMVPVEGAEALGLRPAISSVELEQVWRILSDSPEDLPDDNKKRYKVLEDKLKTQETFKVAEVVRDLAWRKLCKDRLNTPAQRIYDQAIRLLAGEVAVSQGVQIQSARSHIIKMLDENLVSTQV
jgi:CarD family transcriptional regulator